MKVYHPTDRPNFCYVEHRGKTWYFSYSTCIGFRGSDGLIMSENQWGPTTGKHLNWISTDRNKRLPYEEFQKLLEKELV